MRNLGQAIAALALLLCCTTSAVQAQSNTGSTPPCTPPPGTASAIVCFGDTPCPAGYIDPVGGRLRNLAGIGGENPMVPVSQERWLCQESVPDTSSATGNPTPAAAPPAAAGPTIAKTTVQVLTNSSAGQYLADPYGMTLYTRTADPPGASSCAGSCSVIWIALQPPSGSMTLPSNATGTLGVINRDDGTQQVTYNGAPLYLYTGDLQPGDVNGTIAGAYQPATP
jgi:predicted lipoprotein with Yx(FWY)xxD motif